MQSSAPVQAVLGQSGKKSSTYPQIVESIMNMNRIKVRQKINSLKRSFLYNVILSEESSLSDEMLQPCFPT